VSQPESIAPERWLAIPGYGGCYEASDRGRIRTLDRLISPGLNRSEYVRQGRILSPRQDRGGYRRVKLNYLGIATDRQVAHLVLETFIGPRPEGMQCCHWDDNAANDNLTNLRWDTYEANRQDVVRNNKKSNNLNKTECPQKHPYSPENTYARPSRRSQERICRTCTYERNKARRLAKSAVPA
jgi:hypothetical protein